MQPSHKNFLWDERYGSVSVRVLISDIGARNGSFKAESSKLG